MAKLPFLLTFNTAEAPTSPATAAIAGHASISRGKAGSLARSATHSPIPGGSRSGVIVGTSGSKSGRGLRAGHCGLSMPHPLAIQRLEGSPGPGPVRASMGLDQRFEGLPFPRAKPGGCLEGLALNRLEGRQGEGFAQPDFPAISPSPENCHGLIQLCSGRPAPDPQIPSASRAKFSQDPNVPRPRSPDAFPKYPRAAKARIAR